MSYKQALAKTLPNISLKTDGFQSSSVLTVLNKPIPNETMKIRDFSCNWHLSNPTLQLCNKSDMVLSEILPHLSLHKVSRD